MENIGLKFYNALKTVPNEAKKPITAGRLKGMTDINPMWRIKRLTVVFGPCGVGWYPEIVKQWTETGTNGGMMAFCNVNLYIRLDGEEWSKPIPGTGGAALIAVERNGPHDNDEAFKMAYTDALSVAAKMLGLGADVYFEKDRDKYTPAPESEPVKICCKKCGRPLVAIHKGEKSFTVEEAQKAMNGLCVACWREAQKAAQVQNGN